MKEYYFEKDYREITQELIKIWVQQRSFKMQYNDIMSAIRVSIIRVEVHLYILLFFSELIYSGDPLWTLHHRVVAD